MTQPISGSEACSPRRMLGIATLTMVRSSRVMKKPRLGVASTAHAWPRHLRMIVAFLLVAEFGRGRHRAPGQPALADVGHDGAQPVHLGALQRDQVLGLEQVDAGQLVSLRPLL